MKLTIFLVLSCFLASTFTTSTSDTLRHISEGQFGRTLLDTIQLELSSDSKADPRPRILQLLQEIKDEALEALDNLNDQHKAEQDRCQSEQTTLQNDINSLNNQIQSDSAEIIAKQSELEAVTAERDARQSIVDTLQPYLDQITSQRNQQQEDFEKEDNRRAQIIAVLERTRQFITDRLEARQAELSGTFLEKENVLVQVKETVLGIEFQKLSPGWGQLIAFLATKALNKLKQDEDAQATAGLQSIVNLINQIIADTNVYRNNAQDANNAQQEAFDEESADLNNRLSIARAEISASNARLNSVQNRIDELKGAVAQNNQIVSDKKDALAASELRCEDENDTYTKTFKVRNDELALIDEVIAIVNNDLTGLRQYTEDTIRNSDIVVDDD